MTATESLQQLKERFGIEPLSVEEARRRLDEAPNYDTPEEAAADQARQIVEKAENLHGREADEVRAELASDLLEGMREATDG